jgi:hypothetical protein
MKKSKLDAAETRQDVPSIHPRGKQGKHPACFVQSVMLGR